MALNFCLSNTKLKKSDKNQKTDALDHLPARASVFFCTGKKD
ncbi:hypothetical protein B4144_2104 [Bacillus atrophaeus]|nr:hypothetical protein B4144_2104 [Bacillus atrophaeus]